MSRIVIRNQEASVSSDVLTVCNKWTTDITVEFIYSSPDGVTPTSVTKVIAPASYDTFSSPEYLDMTTTIVTGDFTSWQFTVYSLFGSNRLTYKITEFPPMEEFGTVDSNGMITLGDWAFNSFNRFYGFPNASATGGVISYFPPGSLDTSKITTVGRCNFDQFADGDGALYEFPEGSFRFDNLLETKQRVLTAFVQNNTIIKKLPKGSMNFPKLHTMMCGSLEMGAQSVIEELPEGSFQFPSLTALSKDVYDSMNRNHFFNGFFSNGKIKNLPKDSFSYPNLTDLGPGRTREIEWMWWFGRGCLEYFGDGPKVYIQNLFREAMTQHYIDENGVDQTRVVASGDYLIFNQAEAPVPPTPKEYFKGTQIEWNKQIINKVDDNYPENPNKPRPKNGYRIDTWDTGGFDYQREGVNLGNRYLDIANATTVQASPTDKTYQGATKIMGIDEKRNVIMVAAPNSGDIYAIHMETGDILGSILGIGSDSGNTAGFYDHIMKKLYVYPMFSKGAIYDVAQFNNMQYLGEIYPNHAINEGRGDYRGTACLYDNKIVTISAEENNTKVYFEVLDLRTGSIRKFLDVYSQWEGSKIYSPIVDQGYITVVQKSSFNRLLRHSWNINGQFAASSVLDVDVTSDPDYHIHINIENPSDDSFYVFNNGSDGKWYRMGGQSYTGTHLYESKAYANSGSKIVVTELERLNFTYVINTEDNEVLRFDWSLLSGQSCRTLASSTGNKAYFFTSEYPANTNYVCRWDLDDPAASTSGTVRYMDLGDSDVILADQAIPSIKYLWVTTASATADGSGRPLRLLRIPIVDTDPGPLNPLSSLTGGGIG